MPRIEQRALDLFDEYVDLPPSTQASALKKLSLAEPEVYAALLALLKADGEVYIIDEPPLAALASSNVPDADALPDPEQLQQRIGSRLGAWQLEKLLGVGGMGAVYLARRADGQYEQNVAVKCLRKELSTPEVVRAFHNERNLLARLNHSFIVPMIDGGVDEDGSPWFAMQQVEGLPIDRWCDQHQLTLRERVELFIQACDAIAYAHGQMVVHQDIKPSNLMINQRGRPKLLDFGLSALLSDGNAEHRRIAFSSGYSAPEVLTGRGPSAAMDIYSLGVVLYQLLCADWPRKMRAADLLMPTASAPEATPPSQLALRIPVEAVAARRFKSNAALSRALAGDLDAICLKCVAHSAQDRYSSVLELIQDLRAWQERRPISIRTGASYQLGRFLRRNAIPLSLSALVVLAVCGGLGMALWQSRRADVEARSAATINALFEDTLGSAALSGLGVGQINSRQLLDATERRLRDLPEGQNDLVLARGLAALATGFASIGDYTHATVLATEARALGEDNPRQSARNAATLATLLNLQSRYPQAEAIARSALMQLMESGQDADSQERVQLQSALARSRWGQGDQVSAFHLVQQALTSAEHMGRSGRESQAQLLILRGSWKNTLLDLRGAEHDLQRAVALAADRYPGTTDSANEQLAQLYLSMMHVGDAKRIALLLLGHRRNTVGDEHPETGRAWLLLAQIQQMDNEWQPARESLRHADRILRRSLGDVSPELAGVLIAQSSQAMEIDANPRQAISLARQAAFVTEHAHGPTHPATIQAKSNLAVKLVQFADIDANERERHYQEADLLFRELLELSRNNRLPTPLLHLRYAVALLAMGKSEEAERQIGISSPLIKAHFGEENSMWLASRYLHVNVLVSHGQYAQASQQLDEVINEINTLRPDRINQSLLIDAYELQGRLALDRGDREQARTSWDNGLAIASKLSPTSLKSRKLQHLLADLQGPTPS